MNKLNRFGNKHRQRLIYLRIQFDVDINASARVDEQLFLQVFCQAARHFRDPQTWTSLALWLRIGPNLWLLGTEFTLQRLLRLQLFELATPSPILGIGAVCYAVKEETDTEAHRGNAEDAQRLSVVGTTGRCFSGFPWSPAKKSGCLKQELDLNLWTCGFL